MPPQETPNTRVSSEPTSETDPPSHVSVKKNSWVVSDLRNSYDYTQDNECITLEGHYEDMDDVDGPIPLSDIVSDTQSSVYSK